MTCAPHSGRGAVALDAPQRILDAYSKRFLVLDFDHLFVSASLREEIWLLQGKDDPELLARILSEMAEFFPAKQTTQNRHGEFQRYSGGQQAVVAALLIIALIIDNQLHGQKIMMRNVLESLSPGNHKSLLMKFEELRRSHGVELYLLKGDAVQPVTAP